MGVQRKAFRGLRAEAFRRLRVPDPPPEQVHAPGNIASGALRLKKILDQALRKDIPSDMGGHAGHPSCWDPAAQYATRSRERLWKACWLQTSQ